jgi:SAM-dependent methyltransferase
MEKAKNSYIKTANIYDLEKNDILNSDIPFYMEYAEKQNGYILELGCGTGRVSIELAKNGFNVTGLDLSEQMLSVFKNKINSLPENIQKSINLIHENMADFRINKKYSLIIAPFRAFQTLTKDKDINKSLECIKEHLDINGIFIINVFRPSKILDESWCSEEKIQWEQEDPGTGHYIIKKDFRERIDTKNQIIYPKFIFEIKDKKGNVEKIIENLELKYYYYDQLRTKLIENGFLITEEYGWYDKSKIENGKELIMICRQKGAYST